MAISRLGKKGTREPFRRKRIVLPAICRDIFNAARTELCLNLSAQGDVQRVGSSQSKSGAMATDQRSRLMEDCRCHLNRLHVPKKSVERLFSWWKSAGRIRVMERKSGLAFHRGEFTGAGIAPARMASACNPRWSPSAIETSTEESMYSRAISLLPGPARWHALSARNRRRGESASTQK
jgi:hypothetical protein